MSFSQIPFLPLIEQEPSQLDSKLLPALARIVPLLLPASLAASTLPHLPSNAEYYILDDVRLSLEDAIGYLDKGARRVVSKNTALLTAVPADRLIFHLEKPDAAFLGNTDLLANISGVLLETATFVEEDLKPVRVAIKKKASGRPLDLFVLSAVRTAEKVLVQPAAFKLMSKTVGGTSVIPSSFLSTDLGNLIAPHPDDGKLSLATLFTSALRSDRQDGLFVTVPISLTSVTTPLGLVYSSHESVAHSILSGNAVYYSRSRNGLWRKGETSGAMQVVERIRIDCDFDALEFGVIESGPNGEKEGFCHVPEQTSCFGGVAGLAELESTLKKRMAEAPAGSYTKRLFDEPKLLRAKIMEEAGEVCDAETKEELAGEVADLLYFTLTRAVSMGVSLKDVQQVLEKRSLKVTRRKGDAKPEWVQKLGLSSDQAIGVDGEK
ncbi:Histidine biosynthesis bifunctional protein his7 [Rhodotorula toruloides]|nr:Histidine biosynthesis bifunctional protein his7 [Rhodotorula toruloides]